LYSHVNKADTVELGQVSLCKMSQYNHILFNFDD